MSGRDGSRSTALTVRPAASDDPVGMERVHVDTRKSTYRRIVPDDVYTTLNSR